ncbi:MAG: VWA domain-containing protein [Legionellales bacterium]
MMTYAHFLRPWWFLALFPLLGLLVLLWQQKPLLQSWVAICDRHLLDHLVKTRGGRGRKVSLCLLGVSALFMIVGLAGPTWIKLPVSTYKPIQPRVLVLDMSENMMDNDMSPNRLARAKFKIHDLLSGKTTGQFGLVAYTGEPFVVAPLTDDGQTISALLPQLTPGIMPVGGERLDSALAEAQILLKNAGYQYGQILVFTADSPSSDAIARAKELADKGLYSSIMPVTADKRVNPLFQQFASAGKGWVIPYASGSPDLQHWLGQGGNEALIESKQDDIPLWRDEGRWFLIPALLFLLPVFRRGWLQRVSV